MNWKEFYGIEISIHFLSGYFEFARAKVPTTVGCHSVLPRTQRATYMSSSKKSHDDVVVWIWLSPSTSRHGFYRDDSHHFTYYLISERLCALKRVISCQLSPCRHPSSPLDALILDASMPDLIDYLSHLSFYAYSSVFRLHFGHPTVLWEHYYHTLVD